MKVKELISFYCGGRKIVISIPLGDPDEFNDLRLDTDAHQLLDIGMHPILKWVLDCEVERFVITSEGDEDDYAYLLIFTKRRDFDISGA